MKKFLPIFAFVLKTKDIFSCGCDQPQEIRDVRKFDSIIFEGTVETVNKQVKRFSLSDSDMIFEAEVAEVTFKVAKVHKGKPGSIVKIRFSYGGDSCALIPLDFKTGDRYQISAIGNGDKYSNNFCNLRKRLGNGLTPPKNKASKNE